MPCNEEYRLPGGREVQADVILKEPPMSAPPQRGHT